MNKADWESLTDEQRKNLIGNWSQFAFCVTPSEKFYKYWKGRKYRHPQDGTKSARKRIKAFYYAGWNAAIWAFYTSVMRQVMNDTTKPI